MKISCRKCELMGFFRSARSDFKHAGYYYRSSDRRYIRRHRCNFCRSTVSSATFSPFKWQKKRQFNCLIEEMLSSTSSQRRTAKVLELNRKTVIRTFRIMSDLAREKLNEQNKEKQKATVVEFDDLETFEHTKCKPISVTLAVESGTRRILGIEVSRMPANGPLAKKAKKKYGPRPDDRRKARERLFKKIQDYVSPYAVIKSDSNPHYTASVKKFFPLAKYVQYKGQRGSLGGQGELKKVQFDPLFSLNHTCAKMRADINRLIRKTWCTTKNMHELYRHLMLWANYHNKNLPPSSP